MPLILAKPNNDGSRDVIIILGPENIERMKEKDPVEVEWHTFPFAKDPPRLIGITYASDAEMTQIAQLARQGKMLEAINMATSGWKYRPEMGDHDLGYEQLGGQQ
jgi:hypothetical protein